MTTDSSTSKATARGGDALAGSHELVDLAPGIFGQPQAGWLVTIETGDGLVQIDTGDQAQGSLASIRARTEQPFHAIVYSHGHQRYNLSCREWVVHNVERFGIVPRIIAHRNVLARQRRYNESNGVQNGIIERQFRYPKGTFEGRIFPFMAPTETFDDVLRIETRDRIIDVLWAPGETDDGIAAWLPDEKILYGGPACIPFFPNVGSPQRTWRDAARWANTLDRLALYPAELLIREFGPPLSGQAEIAEYLGSTSAALRWCHRTVVDLMNQGYNSHEIVNMVEPPPEVFDKPWLREGYTSIEHVLRDVYRGQFGWWEDLNPTSLHPAHPAAVAREIRDAISDPAAVLARARKLSEAGEWKLALHVIDLLAMGDGADEVTVDARSLKADLCRKAAKITSSYVTQSLYLNGADELEAKNAAKRSDG
ncbi:MAG: alkyl sulfatase [Chloroflexi bacterium]|nr:alkyl sulfatase [Chloroflexota bacterium]